MQFLTKILSLHIKTED